MPATASRRRLVVLLLLLTVVALVRFWPSSPPPQAPAKSSSAASAVAVTGSPAPAPPARTLSPSPQPAVNTNSSAPLEMPASGAPVKLRVDAPASVQAGDNFSVTVNVQAQTGMRRLNLTVDYDRQVLQLAGSTQGTLGQSAGIPVSLTAQEPSDGTVLVMLQPDSPAMVTGSGSVVVLEFHALRPGSSPIALSAISFKEDSFQGTLTLPPVEGTTVSVR